MTLTVKTIADRLKGTLRGAGSAEIVGVAGIREAQPGEISFQTGKRYAVAVNNTGASAVIVDAAWDAECPCDVIKVEAPEVAFAQVATWFAAEPVQYAPGIHPTAIVDSTATLGDDVHIGPYCILDADVAIGPRTVLCGLIHVGRGTSIGEDGRIYQHVSIREDTKIGDRVIIQNGAVIGTDGFGYNPKGECWERIPQLGIVQIGDDVEIGANTTIDRARFGKTVIGDGVKIDNLVQVAHNVQVGDHSALAGQAGISGSTILGRHVQLAGQAGLAGHLSVGNNAIVGAKSGLMNDVPDDTFVLGLPAMPHVEFGRFYANQMHVGELRKRVKELEKKLSALERTEES